MIQRKGDGHGNHEHTDHLKSEPSTVNGTGNEDWSTGCVPGLHISAPTKSKIGIEDRPQIGRCRVIQKQVKSSGSQTLTGIRNT